MFCPSCKLSHLKTPYTAVNCSNLEVKLDMAIAMTSECAKAIFKSESSKIICRQENNVYIIEVQKNGFRNIVGELTNIWASELAIHKEMVDKMLVYENSKNQLRSRRAIVPHV